MSRAVHCAHSPAPTLRAPRPPAQAKSEPRSQCSKFLRTRYPCKPPPLTSTNLRHDRSPRPEMFPTPAAGPRLQTQSSTRRISRRFPETELGPSYAHGKSPSVFPENESLLPDLILSRTDGSSRTSRRFPRPPPRAVSSASEEYTQRCSDASPAPSDVRHARARISRFPSSTESLSLSTANLASPRIPPATDT